MRKIERPKSGQQLRSVFAATAVSVTMTVATAMVAFVVAVACFFAARAFAAAAAFPLFSVSVTAAAFFFVSKMSMASASAFFMTMTMVAASTGGRGFNVVLKRSGDESSNGDIAIAFVAGIKRDVGLRERLHGARSETAANDAVNGVLYEKVHHGGVTVAACGNRFGRNDGSVLHNIDLEVGRHAEVLEDSVVFDWQSDFHVRNSLNFILRG